MVKIAPQSTVTLMFRLFSSKASLYSIVFEFSLMSNQSRDESPKSFDFDASDVQISHYSFFASSKFCFACIANSVRKDVGNVYCFFPCQKFPDHSWHCRGITDFVLTLETYFELGKVVAVFSRNRKNNDRLVYPRIALFAALGSPEAGNCGVLRFSQTDTLF